MTTLTETTIVYRSSPAVHRMRRGADQSGGLCAADPARGGRQGRLLKGAPGAREQPSRSGTSSHPLEVIRSKDCA